MISNGLACKRANVGFHGGMNEIYRKIDSAELQKLRESAHPPILLDVRLEEDCQCSRLPGASNNCVFEVGFVDRLSGLVPEKTTPVCVYGACADSQESRMAAEKLCRAGYTEVYDLREGLEGWRDAGLATEEFAVPAPVPTLATDGVHPVNLQESSIRWTGRNLLNRHDGQIGLKSGALRIESGRLTGGSLVIDMCSITNNDLAGTPLHEVLIRHLMDHDFFDAGKFPEATVEITGAADIPGSTPGSANLSVTAVLTLKGVSETVVFPASTGITAEGKLAAQATLSFDRTKWNVIYGSGRWFRHLGGHLVNDLIELQLRIVTE